MTYSYAANSRLVSVPSVYPCLSASEQGIRYCRFNFYYEYKMGLAEGLIDQRPLRGSSGQTCRYQSPGRSALTHTKRHAQLDGIPAICKKKKKRELIRNILHAFRPAASSPPPRAPTTIRAGRRPHRQFRLSESTRARRDCVYPRACARDE